MAFFQNFNFKRNRNSKEYMQSIKRYSPGSASRVKSGETSQEKLVIGLFGHTGVGKSSLINSFLSIYRESKFEALAPVSPKRLMRPHTIQRNKYELTDNIRLVDNRGMDDFSKEETVDEIQAQLGKFEISDKIHHFLPRFGKI